MASPGVIGTGAAGCIAAVRNIPFAPQRLPDDITPHVQRGALVRLVLPLSSTDTLTIYELGKRRADGIELTDPDTALLITRQGRPVFRFSIRDLRLPKTDYDREWGASAVAMKAAHLCSNNADITYLVLQAGNQGGFFVALTRDAEAYRLVPIKPVQQGRIELRTSKPTRVVVWSVADEDTTDCTACPKHYVVETMDLDGHSFRTVEKRRTTKRFASFQDDPLVVSPGDN